MPLNYKGIYPAADPEFAAFSSRRSVVHSTKGIVSSTQPLANNCGLRVLQQGGNCAVFPSRLDGIVYCFVDTMNRMQL